MSRLKQAFRRLSASGGPSKPETEGEQEDKSYADFKSAFEKQLPNYQAQVDKFIEEHRAEEFHIKPRSRGNKTWSADRPCDGDSSATIRFRLFAYFCPLRRSGGGGSGSNYFDDKYDAEIRALETSRPWLVDGGKDLEGILSCVGKSPGKPFDYVTKPYVDETGSGTVSMGPLVTTWCLKPVLDGSEGATELVLEGHEHEEHSRFLERYYEEKEVKRGKRRISLSGRLPKIWEKK